jgi:hypothetical protein
MLLSGEPAQAVAPKTGTQKGETDDETDLVQTREPKMALARSRTTLLIVLLASAFGVVGAKVHQDTRPQLKVTNLQNAELPTYVRVEMFANHLIFSARPHPAVAAWLLSEYGLNVDQQALNALSELYGDYLAEERARWRQADVEARGDEVAALDAHDAIVRDAIEYEGTVFGTWLRQLDAQGYDTEPFVRTLFQNPPDGGMGFLGREPSPSLLQSQGQAFGEGFAAGYGKSLQALLRPASEGETP